MSDSPDQFDRNTKAMLDLAIAQLDRLGKLFASKMVWKVIFATPGPNNQLPDTEYYAVGRLRGAYTIGDAPISEASRWDGGPLDGDGRGESVHAALEAQIMEGELKRAYYLNNDVAYGYIVHWGGGRMPSPRRYIFDQAQEAVQIQALQEALPEAMAA